MSNQRVLLLLFFCVFFLLFFSACTPSEIITHSTDSGEINYFFVFLQWLVNFVFFIGIPFLISMMGGEFTYEITRTIGSIRVGTGQYVSGYNDPVECNNWANAFFIFLPLLVYYIRTLFPNISKGDDIFGIVKIIEITSHSNLNVFITISLPVAILIGLYFLCKLLTSIVTPIRVFVSWAATIALGGFALIRFIIFLVN